ncbi:MAG: hypothetical protein C5B49_06700 [Bdellovibrio sp.]|nr:MAG: hypothetical protein C5B49_06700 [Bdellovibrio sp.]
MKSLFDKLPERKWEIDISQLAVMAEFARGQDELELVMAVVRAYLEAGPALVMAMKNAMGEANFEQIKFVAHRLKASSFNVGATRLSAMCGEIEEDAGRGSLDRTKNSFAEFASCYEASQKDLEFLTKLVKKGIHVLVVEDDMSLRPIWQSLFDRFFPIHSMDWVISGSEALNKIRQCSNVGFPYNLIVTDIFLAGAKTGLDVLDQVQKTTSGPFEMILTSGADREKVVEYTKAYPRHPWILGKPLVQAECESVLQHALSNLSLDCGGADGTDLEIQNGS